MNIAYIIPKLSDKAPILIVLELVKKMQEHHHHCIIYYFDKGIELKAPCATKHISFKEKFDFNQYDIVHCHGLRPDLYIYFHKPRKHKTLFVTTLHSYIIPDLISQYNKFIALIAGKLWIHCLQKQDKIVTLSNNAINYYKKWFPLSKLYRVYNTREIENETIPIEIEKELLSFKKDHILIGVNAMLSPIKGIDQLIQSLPFLPQHKLYIAGDGKSKKDLIQLASKLGVLDRCYFAGYQPKAYRLLMYYDIYAMPSRNEGFSLALLEAAILKKNIVCSDIPIFRELYTEEEVSFFTIDNIPSLVDSIKSAYTAQKGNDAHRKYLEKYSPECFYQEYIKIYNSNL